MKKLVVLLSFLFATIPSVVLAETLKTPVEQCPAVAKAIVEHFKGLKQSVAIGFDAQKIVEYVVRANPQLMGAPDELLDMVGEQIADLCIQAKGETNIPKE